MDRLAASVSEGTLAEIRRTMPTLRKRVDEVEANLAAAYTALVGDYGRWKLALDDLDNVWALAVWRSSVADEPVETEGRRAA